MPGREVRPGVWVGAGHADRRPASRSSRRCCSATAASSSPARAHRPAHRRRRLRHRARRRARGRDPLGRRARPARNADLAGSIVGRDVHVHHEAIRCTRAPSSVTARTSVDAGADRPPARVEPRRASGPTARVAPISRVSVALGQLARRLRSTSSFPGAACSAARAGRWLCAVCARSLRPPRGARAARGCGAARPRRRLGAVPSAAAATWPSARPRAAFAYEGPARRAGHGLQVPRPALAGRRDGRAGARRRSAPSALAAAEPASNGRHLGAGHRDHQLERGFNQAELLARGLARAPGSAVRAPLLGAPAHGARQSGLERGRARRQCRDAFAVAAATARRVAA